ncbi:MAG: hypothetical protein KatS3mg124_2421 [Porticoccaceae bacterium]|nr:MAG: hypothetical protein KatS3mg124_2421 [Porticoccaceae bacterium]
MSDPVASELFVALCQAKARYCHALDGKQWDDWASLLARECEFDWSEDTGGPPLRGREAVVAFVRDALEGATTAHQVHLPLVLSADDTAAEVIFPLQDRLVWNPPRDGIAAFTGYGEYRERWIREQGAWRIARLVLHRFHRLVERAP